MADNDGGGQAKRSDIGCLEETELHTLDAVKIVPACHNLAAKYGTDEAEGSIWKEHSLSKPGPRSVTQVTRPSPWLRPATIARVAPPLTTQYRGGPAEFNGELNFTELACCLCKYF